MARKGTYVYKETTTTIDENGEILESKSSKVLKLPVEPSFIKMYLYDLTSLLGLPAKAVLLMQALLMKMDFENVITLNARKKKEIVEALQIKNQTLDNYLSKLVEAEVIKRISRGEYLFNPNFFAKGTWANVYEKQEEWELVVTYGKNGSRTIEGRPKAVVEEDLDL